ncbi:hypothetical protein QQ045_033255 [Rhodiola kirilowii]
MILFLGSDGVHKFKGEWGVAEICDFEIWDIRWSFEDRVKVQSYKFIPLAYQIASRLGSSKDGAGPHNFQFAVFSLVKKMAIDHPYHTIFQRFATRSRGMHRSFASQLCGICEEKKVHAVKRMADKRMARLAEQQLIRGWLA